MCGRYNLTSSSTEIAEALGIHTTIKNTPRYNIAPSQEIMVVRLDDHSAKEIALLRWGLIPSWMKETKSAHKPINAKMETISEKPYFRAAFKKRRCLIPANGFYEWRAVNKEKQPYHFHLPHEELFFFAGLWERHVSQEGEVLESAVIITTNANKDVAKYHDRMPAIVRTHDLFAWLSNEAGNTELLLKVLRSFDEDKLQTTPVSKLVNSPKNDTPACILPVITP